MACFHPLSAFQSKFVKENGKHSIVFTTDNPSYTPIKLPCGQCSGCRLERSRQWAIRCMHEAKLYKNNCFITLTYNEKHIPPDNNLIIEDFQKFMKRFRKKYGKNIRFYHCGEYGPKLGRPHFHACIFNYDFPDQKLWKPKTKTNEAMFRSKQLEKLWSKKFPGNEHKSSIGYSCVQTLTFQSAAYCARYIMKKQGGDQATEHYLTEDGVLRNPEYNSMSRRPGIAKHYFDKFHQDWYNNDFLIMDGKKHRPPSYYDAQYELIYPLEFAELKEKRKLRSLLNIDNQTPERLKDRETCQDKKIATLHRILDKPHAS